MKYNRYTVIIIVLIVATLMFIWGNSLESVAESGAKSQSILRMITPLLELFVGKGNVTDHIVRKIAHIVEFGVLGSELALLIIMRRPRRLQLITNCLFAGLAVAVADESLQLLSGRGSQVSDVLLDFGGVFTGIMVVLLLYSLFRVIKRHV